MPPPITEASLHPPVFPAFALDRHAVRIRAAAGDDDRSAPDLRKKGEFVAGLGDLDLYNGRFAVTPQFPQGTYAYYVTIDDTRPANAPTTARSTVSDSSVR